MTRRACRLVLLAAALAAVGCGGSRDKGKNQDLDRPSPAQGPAEKR